MEIEFQYDRSPLSYGPQTHGAEIVGQLPRGCAQEMDGLPAEIEDVRQEAWRCYYGGDYRAVVVKAWEAAPCCETTSS
jgi:hypothetical protein